MSDPDNPADHPPAGGVLEWLQPIEYNECLEDDDDEGPPEDLPDRRSSCVQSQPSTKHPRSGKPTSNDITYIDVMYNKARFDVDLLKAWPPSGGDCWYGRGEQEGVILCRVPPTRGTTIRWVLVYLMPTKDEESELTLKELESLPWGKNYEKDPVNRELPS